MKVIAFTGKMGSGKSTALEFLSGSKLFDNRTLFYVKFAEPLYDIQEYIYGRIAHVYRRPEPLVKDRKLLQWLGTDWGRNTVSENLWIDIWKNEVETLLRRFPRALILTDDCRFDNEAEAIRKMDGIVIHVAGLRADSPLDDAVSNHVSELGLELDSIDHYVWNNGTVEEFHESLRVLFQELVGRSGSAA